MTEPPRPDDLDGAAGLGPGDPVFALRDRRPEFVAGAAACRTAVLTPQDDLGLPPALRAAVARRVARSADRPALLARYPLPECPSLRPLAEGAMPDDPRLLAIAIHADMIARSPGEASATDLDALLDAGLTVAQVVALSELLAYLSFEMQVAHGLALLKGGA